MSKKLTDSTLFVPFFSGFLPLLLPSHNLHTSLASLKTNAWFFWGVFVVYKKGKSLYHVDFFATTQKRCSAPGIQLEFIFFINFNVGLHVLFITFLYPSVKLFTLF